MQIISIVKSIVRSFVKTFDDLKDKGLITSETLDRYWDFNIHSILQYSLILAARESNIIALPEYRLRLSKPIDKQTIDSRLKAKQRYMRTLRVDVGFLISSKLVGVGEVYTPDEIHGCLPSSELEEPWITPYHKLIHIVEYERNLKFLIIVVGLWKISSWKDAKKRSLNDWSTCWQGLINRLAKRITIGVIFVNSLNNLTTSVLGHAVHSN